MNLYQGYCYSSLSDVADVSLTDMLDFNSTSGAAPVSYTLLDAQSVRFTVKNQAGATYELDRTFPTCSSVGYQHNFSGLTLEDSVISSWLVFGVFASVYAIKLLRRGL